MGDPEQTRFDPDCPFCRIAAGQDDAVTVCEEAGWLAFLPPEPATPGHTLVIPRVHAVSFWSLGDEAAGELGLAASRVGRAVDRALRPDGMNLITSAGSAAEQTVEHVHLHILPRWKDDAVGPIWPPKQATPSAELRELAHRIAAECG